MKMCFICSTRAVLLGVLNAKPLTADRFTITMKWMITSRRAQVRSPRLTALTNCGPGQLTVTPKVLAAALKRLGVVWADAIPSARL